nr:MAG TPA: MYST MYST family zinc finger domain [Microviridae sp.]
MEDFIVFFVNKNGLNDFVVIKALDLEDAMYTSKLFSKASKCEILGVCRDCFKSFKLDQYE